MGSHTLVPISGPRKVTPLGALGTVGSRVVRLLLITGSVSSLDAPKRGNPKPFFDPVWRGLRSRLGLRLLSMFALCTVLPTCAVAYLSWVNVSGQLTRQGSAQLEALGHASANQILNRLEFLANDLVQQSSQVTACAGPGIPIPAACFDGLLYGVESIAPYRPNRVREPSDSVPADLLALLGPGRPRLLVVTDSLAAQRSKLSEPRLYLVHRPGATSQFLLVRLNREYLWSATDDEGLPVGVRLSLLMGGIPVFGEKAGEGMLSIEKPMGDSKVLGLPRLQVSMSEPLELTLQPMRTFARSFPLLLGLALLLPVVLTLWQLRRSLAPLTELTAATSRIAQGDFLTPVQVSTGDELEKLGSAFNGMTGQLDRQFRAISTAAEIDRAILSAPDSGSIARIVLERTPEVFPCEAVSLTVLGSDRTPGVTWLSEPGVPGDPKPSVAVPGDLWETNWFAVDPEQSIGVPDYLGHLARSAGTPFRIVAYPLRLSDELQGLLAVRISRDDAQLDSLPFLHRLADQVAVALANARMMSQVRRLAFSEPVTGLPNRAHYHRRLALAITRRAGPDERVAVCTIDLHGFSQINETLGHRMGDQLLREVGKRFAECVGQGPIEPPGTREPTSAPERILFHLGGDQFAVIATGRRAREIVEIDANILLGALTTPFRLGPEEILATASAGIAVFPEDGQDGESLHRNAEVSLSYAERSAIRRGGNTVEWYLPVMGAERRARMELERELRWALDRREFLVMYQPIVDLESGSVSGAEALVRWAHPERGTLLPSTFISCCEESGLILPLGEWVLREVCAQIARWQRHPGFPALRVSVNMSARQFLQQSVVHTVETALRDAGIQPERLGIELTESCLMEGSEVSARKLRELAELRVGLAVDDFGTGYSSLSYLRHFPVSTLKIDRSFVVGIPDDPEAAALTRAVIALGLAMDLDIVAEGVESRAQAAFLRKRRCPKAQGYLYGRSLTAEDFLDLIRGKRLLAS